MSPEECVVQRLITVGTTAGTRIVPLRLKQPVSANAFPAIVFQRISSPRQYTQDGDAKLPEPRVQLKLWSKTYTELEALAEEVREALSGWKDDTLGIGHCFLMYEMDDFEEQSGLFWKVMDAQIGYKGF
jgi:hypothetical protein